MRLRRLAAIGVTLAVTSGVFLLGASPASAQGYCPKDMAGWQVARPAANTPWPFFPKAADGITDLQTEVVVYARSLGGSTGDLMVQFRNLGANGKSNLVGMVGRAANTSDLGVTGSIGAAPVGAWCSDVVHGTYIWSSLTYQAYGRTFYANIYGYITFDPA